MTVFASKLDRLAETANLTVEIDIAPLAAFLRSLNEDYTPNRN